MMKLSDLQQSLSIPNLQWSVPLARFTTMRVGGPAEALVEVETAEALAGVVSELWKTDIPFMVLGGGSNVLISDRGLRSLVIVNHARPGERFSFQDVEAGREDPVTVWAESGVNFSGLARQAVARDLSGLEWAAGIPGTVGGAVVGNAGAHGGDVAGCLVMAEILHPIQGSQSWSVERMEYRYRGSVLKGQHLPQPAAVVLSATFRLARSTPEVLQPRLNAIAEKRRLSQPPGANMGSMFRNPPGDYAGRLIEAAGLKGTRLGGAEISQRHGNFFINDGTATAADIYGLVKLAQQTVAEKFGVNLELEIELLGEF